MGWFLHLSCVGWYFEGFIFSEKQRLEHLIYVLEMKQSSIFVGVFVVQLNVLYAQIIFGLVLVGKTYIGVMPIHQKTFLCQLYA